MKYTIVEPSDGMPYWRLFRDLGTPQDVELVTIHKDAASESYIMATLTKFIPKHCGGSKP